MNTAKAKAWLNEQPESQGTTYLREALKLIDELESELTRKSFPSVPSESPPS